MPKSESSAVVVEQDLGDAVGLLHGGGDTTVECSGSDHAVHIAEDFARHARVTADDGSDNGAVVEHCRGSYARAVVSPIETPNPP